MALPTNIDTTYADTGTADVPVHQQHHDVLHGGANVGLGARHGNFVTGRWYDGHAVAVAPTADTVSLDQDRVLLVPIFIAGTQTFDAIGLFVSTAAAGGYLRMGVYRPASTGLPGARVLDAGTVACATTGEKTIAISQSLSGHYYLAVAVFGYPLVYGWGQTVAPSNFGRGTTVANGTGIHYRAAAGYTALPADLTGLTSALGSAMPAVMLRAA